MKKNIFRIACGILASLAVFEASGQSYFADRVTITGGGGMTSGGNFAATITIGQPVASGGMSASEPSAGFGFWSLFMGNGSSNPTNPPGLVITYVPPIVFSGAVGGPFTPDLRGLHVSNAANASISYTATASANWFSIFPTFGDFPPGASVSAAVRLTANANALSAGNYTGLVTYVTSTGQSNLTIPVSLSVGQGLSITGPLTFDVGTFIGGPPVTPTSVTNHLRNGTSVPMTWAAILRNGAVNYLSLSQTGGTLAPGETTTVIASLNGSANHLTSPLYSSGDIWFTNLTSGVGSQSHSFSLSIVHALALNPVATCSAGGYEGGPFWIDHTNYVLQNNTGIAQDWSVSHPDWLDLSPTSGTLAPWAWTNITFAISIAATRLPGRTMAYQDTNRFFLPAYPQDSALVYASLSVFTVPPRVTSQPGHHTVWPGSPLMLTVSAIGSQPLSYQWLHDGVEIPGGTNSTLMIASVSAADAGHYSARVRNPYFSPQTSLEGTLALFSIKNGNPKTLQITKSSADHYRIDVRSFLTEDWTLGVAYASVGYTNVVLTVDVGRTQRFYRAVYSP